MVSPMGVQAGADGGQADRGQVDGGREILAADMAERIRANRVAGERPEGAGGVSGAVEIRRLGGVVHEDHEAAGQVARGVREPGVQGEADLGDVAVAQDHTLVGEALGEGRRGGLGLEPGERTTRVQRDQELAHAAVPADDPVDRERVEDLVRDHGTRPDGFAPSPPTVRRHPAPARRRPGAPGGHRGGPAPPRPAGTGWPRTAVTPGRAARPAAPPPARRCRPRVR